MSYRNIFVGAELRSRRVECSNSSGYGSVQQIWSEMKLSLISLCPQSITHVSP